LIAPELDHKGVALHLKLTDDLPPVVGVASQVELVLLNLLANAGEACANGSGRIEVETYAVDDEVRLVVRDNGEGMSDNDQARAFEPFSTTKDKSQHLGLGLYLVQRLVEAHLGYVLIESAPGGPTAVTVAIPAAENTDPLLHLEEETS
ncbi:HAMP domain-containing histidine kinase, partial [bacterium]|nr:HAMP domain-containing histidine kinase [bacterium]